jgi:hypothetical protein
MVAGMAELSEEARKELADAIKIVREDKSWKMLSEVHKRSTSVDGSQSTTDAPSGSGSPTGTNPTGTGDTNSPTPPPAQDPPKPDKKRGLWSVGNDDADAA